MLSNTPMFNRSSRKIEELKLAVSLRLWRGQNIATGRYEAIARSAKPHWQFGANGGTMDSAVCGWLHSLVSWPRRAAS